MTYNAHEVHIVAMTLQEWMDKRGWNDARLAKEVGGVSRSQISRIRRGTSRPSLTVAADLERVTGIRAAKFATGEATVGQ